MCIPKELSATSPDKPLTSPSRIRRSRSYTWTWTSTRSVFPATWPLVCCLSFINTLDFSRTHGGAGGAKWWWEVDQHPVGTQRPWSLSSEDLSTEHLGLQHLPNCLLWYITVPKNTHITGSWMIMEMGDCCGWRGLLPLQHCEVVAVAVGHKEADIM